jgi:cytosine permease
MSTHESDQFAGLELESEFERTPVPASHRKSVGSIAAVWFGFPMILTCSVFGGLLAAFLGFQAALAAILVGNLILLVYVGTLAYLSARNGLNFGMQATQVFGRFGSLVAVGFLATVVTGWFAFQVGLTGATIEQSFGWDAGPVTLVAGVLFIAVTFIGIRALSILGLVAAPFFLVVAGVSLYLVWRDTGLGGVWAYPGMGGSSALSFGAGVTLVVATFADSGTMTADFTRWSRNGREAVTATLTAFPIANTVAFTVGAVLVASGAIGEPGVNGGNFLPILVDGHGPLLATIAFLFVFVNLGSVCSHCLYNGAVGWSQMTGQRMRLLTVVLGAIGTAAALAGVWNHLLDWLNILGVFVPPIGAVIIVDQLLRRRLSTGRSEQALRINALVGYAVGALAAGVVHYQAPQLSEVVVGIVVAGIAYWLVDTVNPIRGTHPSAPTPTATNQARLTQETL